MQYNASLPFHGDSDKVFDLAISALAALGFRLTGRTAQSATLVGPAMNSSRQNPLVGASELDLRLTDERLPLKAELGGAERMMKFVRTFPVALNAGLGLVFLVVFGVVFGAVFGPGPWVAVVLAMTLLNGAILVVFGRWMSQAIHAWTCCGLDSFLVTIVAASGPEEGEK